MKHRRKLSKEKIDKDPRINMMQNAKSRAKRNGLPFNISSQDILIPKQCPILGTTFQMSTKRDYYDSPVLGRKSLAKGYIKGNMYVSSGLANVMKNNATSKELATFSKNILKFLK